MMPPYDDECARINVLLLMYPDPVTAGMFADPETGEAFLNAHLDWLIRRGLVECVMCAKDRLIATPEGDLWRLTPSGVAVAERLIRTIEVVQ